MSIRKAPRTGSAITTNIHADSCLFASRRGPEQKRNLLRTDTLWAYVQFPAALPLTWLFLDEKVPCCVKKLFCRVFQSVLFHGQKRQKNILVKTIVAFAFAFCVASLRCHDLRGRAGQILSQHRRCAVGIPASG